MIAGRILYVDGQEIWCAYGRKMLKSSDGGGSWELRASLPARGLREHLAFSRLGRRLARSGYHHFVKTGTDTGLVFAHKHVFQLLPDVRELLRVAHIKGSRPLAICIAQDGIYYGEYRRNPERSPVHVWGSDFEGETWRPVWCFDNVRHVHGVFYDSYTDQIWVTTGDSNSESAIWVTKDRFSTLDYVVGGAQRYRAVQLLFTRDWVYFGSDSPVEKNHIYRMNRQTRELESLCDVGGSVFFATQVGRSLFFSTAVEPSKVNLELNAELWAITGSNGRLIRTFKKDVFSTMFFQHGQINFPAGPGDGKNLYFSPMATACDQYSFIVSLNRLEL